MYQFPGNANVQRSNVTLNHGANIAANTVQLATVTVTGVTTNDRVLSTPFRGSCDRHHCRRGSRVGVRYCDEFRRYRGDRGGEHHDRDRGGRYRRGLQPSSFQALKDREKDDTLCSDDSPTLGVETPITWLV